MMDTHDVALQNKCHAGSSTKINTCFNVHIASGWINGNCICMLLESKIHIYMDVPHLLLSLVPYFFSKFGSSNYSAPFTEGSKIVSNNSTKVVTRILCYI